LELRRSVSSLPSIVRIWGQRAKPAGEALLLLQGISLLVIGIVYPLGEWGLSSVALGAFLMTNCIGLLVLGLQGVTRRKLNLVDSGPVARILIRSGIVIIAAAFGTLAGLFILSFFSPWDYPTLLANNRLAYFRFVTAAIIGVTPLLVIIDWLRARLVRQTRENEELSLLRTRAQLAALQAKVNPHFLFNTLNTVVNLIHKSPDQAESVVLHLASVYHDVLRLPENDTILLLDEIRLVKQYLEIEKTRLGSRLSYDISVADELENMRIVPLLVEPLVENAVFHAIAPKTNGGQINISARRSGREAVISVQDDGCQWKQADMTQGFGLYSVHQRMKLYYGNMAQFIVTQSPESGTCVTLVLPYEDQDTHSR
jgi:signal transduction histidine kinase